MIFCFIFCDECKTGDLYLILESYISLYVKQNDGNVIDRLECFCQYVDKVSYICNFKLGAKTC